MDKKKLSEVTVLLSTLISYSTPKTFFFAREATFMGFCTNALAFPPLLGHNCLL